MSYDEELADRLRETLHHETVTEKRMFGGLAFLVGGNMAVAASSQGGLMLRCDPADAAVHVASPGVSRMVMRGKEMDGWLRVDAEVVVDGAELARWVEVGTTYARSLPAK